MKAHIINILSCFDDFNGSYTRHFAVCMLSILETNKNNKINFFVISSCLPKENQEILKKLANKYHQNINFIIQKNIIPQNIEPYLINRSGLPNSTLYRLFHPLYIKDIDRILYLDCDTIITKDLSNIYNMNMQGKTIVGYLDSKIYRYGKTAPNINEYYINSGALLIDEKKFKENPITIDKIKKANKKYDKRLYFADQDYLNIIYKDEILIYKGINYLVYKPFPNTGLDDATIIHCCAKPNLKYSLCPKKVIKLYNYYLNKTKWRDFPPENNGNYLKYCYLVTTQFILYRIEKRFGIKRAGKFGNLKIIENFSALVSKKDNHH